MIKASIGLSFLTFIGVIAVNAIVPDAKAGPAGRDKDIQLSEMSAQERTVKRRARPRLRVTPRQPSAWTYPRPGTYSWPGPNAVRECRSWLAPETRVSGTVIVPQMRCWWAPG